MSSLSSGSLQPTYHGHVSTARDALKLFEACLKGQLHHVPRRPHDRERNSLIKSGSIFIYEENASGIKRWTDGVPWSPSRILGNFLVYRELIKPFPPGEKKRAQKRPKNNNRAARTADPYPARRRSSGEEDGTYPEGSAPSNSGDSKENERSLIGSLVDSYGFKDGGLVKKTMSVNLGGTHHHMVSYYSLDDVLSGKLVSPSKDKDLDDVEPRPDLIARQNFRAPLDDIELSSEALGALHGGYSGYPDPYAVNRSQMINFMPQPSHNLPNGHLPMDMYSAPAYTSAIPAPAMYSSAPGPQSYYPTATISGSYQPQYQPAPPPSASLPMVEPHSNHQSYQFAHRQSYPSNTSLPSRVNSMDAITPTSDGRGSDTDWQRQGHNGNYSISPLSAQSAYGPSAPSNQWTMPPLQPREEVWNSYGARTGGSSKPTVSHMPGHPVTDNTNWRHIPCP